MVNVWHDFDVGASWKPYVGGGVGFVRVDMGDVEYDSNALAKVIMGGTLPPGVEVPELSPADTAFAYQFGVGVGYPLSDATTVNLGYRLQLTDSLEFSGKNLAATNQATTELRVHLFEVGIRHRF